MRSLVATGKRITSLLQNAPDMVTILDAGGHVQFASPSAAQTLGYEPDALVSHIFVELVHPDDAAYAAQQLAAAHDHPGATRSARWRMCRRDGTWAETENVCTNLLADESVRGLVVSTRDVSERVSLDTRRVHQAATTLSRAG